MEDEELKATEDQSDSEDDEETANPNRGKRAAQTFQQREEQKAQQEREENPEEEGDDKRDDKPQKPKKVKVNEAYVKEKVKQQLKKKDFHGTNRQKRNRNKDKGAIENKHKIRDSMAYD